MRTWSGYVCVAFIIDAIARMIVDWQRRPCCAEICTSTRSSKPSGSAKKHGLDELVQNSDRGVQYLSIRYAERISDDGGVTNVGSRGDSYGKVLAASVIGLFKTELIRNKARGPGSTTSRSQS